MDLKKILIVALVLDVAFLVAAVYFYSDSKAQEELMTVLTEERNAAIGKITSLEEDIKALRSRIALLAKSSGASDSAELDRMRRNIDEKDAEINRLKNTISRNADNGTRDQRAERPGGRGGRRGNPEEFMARLKEENPERYEQIMNERERHRQEMEARVEKRNVYLEKINLDKLSSDQRQVVSDYQALIKANEELQASMREGGNMDSFREVMRNNMRMNELSGSVRDILIEQYAGSGMAEEIKNIIDATSSGFRPGRGGFGGPGRGGFGGQRRSGQ